MEVVTVVAMESEEEYKVLEPVDNKMEKTRISHLTFLVDWRTNSAGLFYSLVNVQPSPAFKPMND